MWVLKVGGRQLDDPDFLAELAEVVRPLTGRVVIVHGGGKGTSALSQRLGLESHFVDGLRVTDQATLECAVMGLAGLAKMQLVQGLQSHGVAALGLTGVDGGFVRCQKLSHPGGDLGHVGEPVFVEADKLRQLASAGWVVCLAPLCLDSEGRLYNVNADPVAAAVASALAAERLIFLTDVTGVLLKGEPIPTLDRKLFEQLLEDGHIGAGMQPKLNACFAALERGVKRVLVTDLKGVASGEGTWVK